MIELLRFLITIIIAYLVGKLVAKMKLPSILGWLITGMVLGPHALSLMKIAAAAVINEIIAVIFAKKGFEWAGELENDDTFLETKSN